MTFQENIGEKFLQETKYARPLHSSRILKKTVQPDKIAPIYLPTPELMSGMDLWKVLKRRRSFRDFTPAPLATKELSNLLWATQGITEQSVPSSYRTAPSAGALHPIDTYLVIHRVEGLKPGIYFFRVDEFSLEMRSEGDFSAEISRAALGQSMAGAAAVVFVWVAVIRRSSQKYRQRAYRYIYLDCGHIAQNLYLAATALNLGCCAVAAFFDDELNALLGVDGREETALYMAVVGKK